MIDALIRGALKQRLVVAVIAAVLLFSGWMPHASCRLTRFRT